MLERPFIRLPVGVRDFLPRAAARRRVLAEAVLGEFERWGYDRIITPAFEYADVLARGLGEDARASAIRFVEPATGEVVALRTDITPQVARLAATRLSDVGGPIRLCYEGSVLRLMPGARGQKELIQAGVELLDAPSPEGDAEVIALAAAALNAAGIDDVIIDVGHVALAREALEGVDDAAARASMRALVAKKDQDAVARAAAALGLPPAKRKLLEALSGLWGEPDETLVRARKLSLSASARRALDDLERALAIAGEVGSERFTIDLGEVRGFEYYTGLRFSAYVPGAGEAVVRGGRYDDLVARYGRPARATGFAIDIEAVAQAQKAAGVAAPAAAPGVLVVAVDVPRDRAFQVARGLRAAGVRVAADLGARRGEDAVRAYAAGVGVEVAVLLGKRGARALDIASRRAAQPIPAGLVERAEGGDGKALAAALGLTARPASKNSSRKSSSRNTGKR
jgi:ATP phosphoribosyltransferase regulatory subunit